MSNAEYVAIALFLATILGLSFLDSELALGLLIIVGIVVVVTTYGGTSAGKGTA